jgi:hypothetical protein
VWKATARKQMRSVPGKANSADTGQQLWRIPII